MRGVYQLSYQTPSGILGERTLMYFTTPSTKCVEILSAKITNKDVDTSEQLEACISLITTLGTPTAEGTPVVQKSEQGDVNCSVPVSGSVTANEPTYHAAPIDRQGFNNLAGYYYDPLPEERPIIPPSTSAGIRLLHGPQSNATTFDVQINIREIG